MAFGHEHDASGTKQHIWHEAHDGTNNHAHIAHIGSVAEVHAGTLHASTAARRSALQLCRHSRLLSATVLCHTQRGKANNRKQTRTPRPLHQRSRHRVVTAQGASPMVRQCASAQPSA